MDQYCRLRENGVHCYLRIVSSTFSLFKLQEFPVEKKTRKILYIDTTQMYFFFNFKFHGSVHSNNILIYIQQDATLHSLFYLETALHVSGVTTTHHQERKQLYLQHLVFVLMMGGGNTRNM